MAEMNHNKVPRAEYNELGSGLRIILLLVEPRFLPWFLLE